MASVRNINKQIADLQAQIALLDRDLRRINDEKQETLDLNQRKRDEYEQLERKYRETTHKLRHVASPGCAPLLQSRPPHRDRALRRRRVTNEEYGDLEAELAQLQGDMINPAVVRALAWSAPPRPPGRRPPPPRPRRRSPLRPRASPSCAAALRW